MQQAYCDEMNSQEDFCQQIYSYCPNAYARSNCSATPSAEVVDSIPLSL